MSGRLGIVLKLYGERIFLLFSQVSLEFLIGIEVNE
jgi:hypothetical protein